MATQATLQDAEALDAIFPSGSAWIRADFHLHTRADKEFKYTGKDNEFVASYVKALKLANIGLGVVAKRCYRAARRR